MTETQSDQGIDDKNIKAGTKLTKLNINSKSTVQPNSLLRLTIFTPSNRSAKRLMRTQDVTDVLSTLEISRQEGYDNIKIIGPRLNLAVDFKVWRGVVRVLNDDGFKKSQISMKFSEFASICGYAPKRLGSELRQQINDSLVRIRSNTLSFVKGDMEGGAVTGLLWAGYWDNKTDTVELVADARLWDLYLMDYQIILKNDILNLLSRHEVAQCLYVYLQAMPSQSREISFKRFRERLNLLSDLAMTDFLIKKGLKKLMDIGYLEGDLVKKNGTNYLLISKKNIKLCK